MVALISGSTMTNSQSLPSLSDLTNAIFRYLEAPNTDYALMINGEWGSGKTFFWRTSIEDRLTKQERKVLYVSLYGVTTAADIDWRTFGQLSHDQQSKVDERAHEILARLMPHPPSEFQTEVHRFGWYAHAMAELGIRPAIEVQ